MAAMSQYILIYLRVCSRGALLKSVSSTLELNITFLSLLISVFVVLNKPSVSSF